MKKSLLVLPALLSLSIALSGCAADPSAAGQWGSPLKPNQPSLLLEQSGVLTGSDGCNRMMGSWSQDGSDVTLKDVATTMMFCDGVDTWLSTATRAELEGDTLVFFDGSDAEVGELTKN